MSFYRCSVECIDILHASGVCQLHCSRKDSAPEGHQHSTEDHQLCSSLLEEL